MVKAKVEWDKGSIREFRKRLDTMGGEVKRKKDRIVEETSKEVKRDAASLTPVRTGRARAGWRVQARKETARIWNNVPYVRYLEYGTRRMRPRRMLRTAMAKGEVRLEQRLRLLLQKEIARAKR